MFRNSKNKIHLHSYREKKKNWDLVIFEKIEQKLPFDFQEIAVRNEEQIEMVPSILTQKYLVYVNPDMYIKWLRTEYKLNNEITLRELPKSNSDSHPSYEIAFDSRITKQEKKIRNERIIMEAGGCQLLAISPSNQSYSSGEPEELKKNDLTFGNGDCNLTSPPSKEESSKPAEKRFPCKNPVVVEALANYEKTKEYLEKALHERGNIQEEVIENVLYTFRLDEDEKLDVVNIIEGVTEPNLQRGFRYTCLFCSKIVLNKLVYDKHIRDVHLNYLVCKVCDKQLYSLRNFLIHTKTHLGVYTFTCPLCGKGLTRASIFKSHMMYHYYGKIQNCQICDKKFRDVFALRRHVQLHDKKIEYICEMCGFGTHLKSNLEYHVRAHADEKSYMCEMCGKQFTAPQSLHHHMKTHEPNFPCPHCKRVFRHENKFINHLEQNHSDSIKYVVDMEVENES